MPPQRAREIRKSGNIFVEQAPDRGGIVRPKCLPCALRQFELLRSNSRRSRELLQLPGGEGRDIAINLNERDGLVSCGAAGENPELYQLQLVVQVVLKPSAISSK